ncbi:FERM, ARHGEF and pleckstrin domain-containing protein 1-like isoform X1 [Entelurus aequoreus]|uniref:FERM, ARHGEF and pleckstrin domain-containing protein 1-like isoform X1 n=1 Tax=Entelurus aequoreus TaxID=161455 RepID=UPI002B1D0CCC|nr:FERM, ARHGEF and pleckstrin domain-containing protein 1-like isoform X1 [Entelurus aequoreus]XP_061925936.1 FERM, ARHGEF and pleckstrin domain-containing protein 1-like isoform X1 [Entelurus aequoreus]XP_061925937.1 FERM, ARHGEF and pleckstrin domain-containing protein 1-like isoform X1 [Entelurus aequoreus]XP_061925938.1 FERM, ARHGEF and pleckstrin domain-containing protein 1-like isoform X1 [Entelurus aequoreus]XP_061925940.1 FERM, ARHGEF and pleckstrin domain-containing protein 1-like iso
MADPDLEPVKSRAGHRLGAPETLGISTLDPAHRPPTMPPGRHVTVRVHMLDDTEELFDVSIKASGKVLFDLVCTHMNLIEGDYFGLEFQNHQKLMVWLDPIKPIMKQLRRPKHTTLRFAVKYFPPDHAQLLEELTRYLFALQIKQDLSSGRLTCNDTSAALMVSHIMQSEIGDFEESQCRSHLLNNNYIPDQMPLIDKIMEFHSMNIGQTPAESDFQLLEVARRLEMYGIRLHPAKDREGSRLSLAVAHTGILVFQGHTKINSFNWSKVRKLSFKRKRFLIKLRPDVNSSYQDTLEFLMTSRDCCKVFWKICVEYHAFFRLFEEPKPKPKPVLFTRGSSFRFSGRTQKQVIDFVRESEFKKLPFERKHSRVQQNSRLSPLPSPRSHEVPTESGVTGDRLDSASQHHWKESVLVNSQETSEAPASPPHQNNRSPSRQEETRDSTWVAHPEHLATGALTNSPYLSTSPGHSNGLLNGQMSLEVGSHSPDVRQPSPLTSPLLNDACSIRTDDEDEVRRKRFPTDRAYFIAKELLTTERTYVKDLEVVTVLFQNAVGQDEATPDSLKNTIFSTFEPLHRFHIGFLREVEQRMALWEGRSNAHIKGDYQRIGDVLLKNLQGLKPLAADLHKQCDVLMELEKACKTSRRLEGLCRDFELQKVCYVPLNVFILRPLHRLVHYQRILERLCKHYPATHVDFRDCRTALADLSEVVEQLQGSVMKTENFQKLLELKKDLIGVDKLAVPGREFIRFGCLSKLSGKGLQQRMFFLFNDVILYSSRGMTATNQFKVHGQLPLHGMTIRESEDEWGVPHAFTLVSQRQSVVVAASSLSEMVKWMEDLEKAIEMAKTSNGPSSDLLSCSLTDNKCPREFSAETESEDDVTASHTSPERAAPHRGNTMVHVCWHRNASVSMVDFSLAVENQLSGNLLRKFKSSNGWQKLWVVFTNFSLFFYKSHQDDYPLASLPLLGYSVTIPSESENIHKDYVFKLHFKSHVYYFRSESKYTFERWMEVIGSATASSSRLRNGKESH